MDPGVDLTDLGLYAAGFPHTLFTELRRDAPVWFHPPTERSWSGEGFWVVVRHADCLAVADDIETFPPVVPSRRGGTPIALDLGDETRHRRFRRLLDPALSPAAMRGVESELHWHAETIVGRALARRGCDLVADVADPMSLQAIAVVLGVPLGEREQWFTWLEAAFDDDDPDRASRAARDLHAYAAKLVEAKRGHPQADLVSKLLHARLDPDHPESGQRLTPDEVVAFFRVLETAGGETLRNGLAQGILALIEHPEQWEALRHDRALLRRGTEEMLRWASPTSFDGRVATCDTVVGGRRIRRGQAVALWWASANRDEAVFEAPFTFDVHRDPNPHLAFGHGTHACLGATLARLTIRLLLDVLVEQCDRVEATGPPQWVRSDRRTGISHLPVVLHAR